MGDLEFKKPLLNKVYYQSCPGCIFDKKKELQTGLPIKELLCIWIVPLCVALPISFLFPFLYFMIKDFNIAEKEEDIGYYAGFVGSAYMIGRTLTSIFWGVVADRYGRKPVIILGTSTVVIFNTLFGFSINYSMAIITRFLLGFLNGLLGPIRAYASELFREEHQALGLSALSTSWGLGLIIGPSLGGYLAQPAEKFPGWVTSDSLLGRFPYLLPCLSISVFALFVTVGAFWLPETLHIHKKYEMESASYVTDAEEKRYDEKDSILISLLKNWPLMSSIIVYCVFSLHDMAYSEIFSLWAVSPKSLGGLSYSTEDVGTILSISAILSGFILSFTLNCASIAKNVLSDQHQRAAAAGIAMTLQSICKTVGPACGGALLSWSQKRLNTAFLPGDQMIFFILNIIEGIGVLLTFKPFLITNHY
ncbi:major facilitator superfamily domain protein (mitochondrion) [Artemisia annua]|uniref:Major facilitator superfamily domain protein n=1 Tax=Artemisia annua TaxID=35608 RepID=A0A2U1N413_ARTAN|nr:major facilitator superfamily domain protein [Artemisia annua]